MGVYFTETGIGFRVSFHSLISLPPIRKHSAQLDPALIDFFLRLGLGPPVARALLGTQWVNFFRVLNGIWRGAFMALATVLAS